MASQGAGRGMVAGRHMGLLDCDAGVSVMAGVYRQQQSVGGADRFFDMDILARPASTKLLLQDVSCMQ
jgi:hypothetical protein